MKSSQVHIAVNVFCFITIIISLYFGMSIFNAKDNQHITHLNNFDKSTQYTLNDIRVLTAQAVIVAGIFVALAFSTQIYSYFVADFKRKKNIILGLLSVYAILFLFSVIVMADLDNKNFYDYGMIWVLLSLSLIFANSVLIFYKKAGQ